MTVDIWQDFEFGSNGNNPTSGNLDGTHSPYTLSWTLNGTTNLNYVRTAASKPSPSPINGITDTGTRGLELDIQVGNEANRAYYAQINKGVSVLSYGFWIYLASPVSNTSPVHVIYQVMGSGFSNQWRFKVGTSAAGALQVVISGTTDSSPLQLTSNAWYWVSITGGNNTTVTMEVFDSAGLSVGSKTATANTQDAYYVSIGSFNVYTAIGSVYTDNFCINYSGITPLKPW